MKLIDIENKVPIIDPAALVIKEFRAIWERDKSKDKRTALEEIAYIYYMADYLSPYRGYDPIERIKRLKEAVISKEDWEPDTVIEEALNRYKALQLTPSIGLLEDAEAAIQKLRQYFRDTDITRSKDGAGAKNLIMNLKQLGDIVKSLKLLRDLVEQEQYETARIRGGGKLGQREVPRSQRKN